MNDTPRPPDRAWLLPLALLLVALGIAVAAATVVIPTRGPMRWDEANHALKALLIAHDLGRGDWLSFAFNSYRQVLYPPLHSWLLAVVYLAVGPSMAAVAGLSLALFLLTAWLIYLAGRPLSHGRANLAGATAALLWLTSPPLLDYAVQGMLEVPGLVGIGLTLLAGLRLLADDRVTPDGVTAPHPRRWVWLGLALALTFFTRTPFGIVLGLAVAVTLFARAGLRPRNWWRPEIGWLLLPLVILLGIWFAYPPKIPAMVQWLVGYPDGLDEPYSVEGWLFYPRAVVWNSGSVWLFMFFVGALGWAWWRRRSSGLLLLTALLVVQFGLGLVHQNKQARFLFPMLPAFFLIAGLAVDGLWRWARSRGPRLLAAFATVLLIVQCGFLVVTSLRPGPGDRPDPVSAAILDKLEDPRPSLVLGSMDMGYPSPPLLDWKLITAGRMTAPYTGTATQVEEGRRLVELTSRLPLPSGLRERLAATFTAYDTPAPVRTLYAGLPLRASYGRLGREYDRFLTALIRDQGIERVIVVNRTNARRYPTAQMVAPLEAAGFARVDEATFGALNTTVLVYTRPQEKP